MMTRTLKTRRLTGRPISQEDWPLIHAIQSDAEHGHWVRGPFNPATIERSKRIARRLSAAWDSGYGPYVWHLAGQPVGYAGLQPTRLIGTDAAEALWGLVSRVHRQGLAREAMETVLSKARPRTEQILSWTLPENIASRTLMERLGFQYQHDRMYAGLRHALYRLGA